MHRIDGSTRSASLPAPLPTGTGSASPGYFAHGDPLGGVVPTIVSPDWANAVQEEIAHVIEGAGLTLDKADHTQLDVAIDQKIEDAFGGPGGASDLSTPGYARLPGGLILQWGSYRASITSETAITVAFPIDFPSACLSRQATVYLASASDSRDFWAQIVGAAAATGMTVQVQSDGDDNHVADGFDWLAIGH